MIISYDKSDKAVLVLSGGLDSCVMLYYLVKRLDKKNIEAIFLNYNQINLGITRDYAQKQLEEMNKEIRIQYTFYEIQSFPWHKLGFYDEKLESHQLYSLEESLEIKKKTFVSGRNSLIALSAMSRADVSGVGEAWMSVQIDPPEWPNVQSFLVRGPKDITPQWVDRANLLGEVSFQNLVRLRTPFLDLRWGKEDIVELGTELGVPFNLTYSCRYHPVCGKCEQCLIRNRYIVDKGLADK